MHKIIIEFDSGQKVKDFCKTTGISKDAYYYWQHKLRQKAADESGKSEGTKGIVPFGREIREELN